MKDHVEIGHLTKYDAFRVNRDQVIDFEKWLKIFMISVMRLKMGNKATLNSASFK